MKRLITCLLMLTVLLPTIAFAATSGNLTITATKTSGQVAIGEEIKYSATTDSTDAGVYSFKATITDAASGKVLENYSGQSKYSTGVVTYSYTIDMPGVPYKNINVAVTFADILGKSVSKTYSYTMDTTQKFDVVADPSSNSVLNVGEKIQLTSTATLPGVGLKKVAYVMYDGSNSKIASNELLLDDEGTGVGVSKSLWKINTPTKTYNKVRLVVYLEDIRGNTYNEIFNYTMNNPTTTLGLTLYDNSTNTVLSNNFTTAPNDDAYITVVSSNSSVGVKSLNLKMYNSSTNVLVHDTTGTASGAVGANPYKYNFTFPGTEGSYKLVATATEIYGTTNTLTTYFTVDDGKQIDLTNEITISSDYSNNSSFPVKTPVKFTAKSSNYSVGIKNLTLKIYDNATGALSATKTMDTTNNELGSNPMAYTLTYNKAGSFKTVVTATDIIGNTKNSTYYYTVSGESEDIDDSNELDITASYPSGSKLKPGTVVKFASNSSNAYVGTKTIKLDVYNNVTNAFVKTFNGTSSQSTGANPLTYNLTISTAGNYRIVVTGTDIKENTKTETFIYVVENDEVEEDENAELTITFNPSSGKEVEAGDDIEIVAKTSVSSDKVVKVSYKMYNEDEEKIASDSESSSGKTSLSIKAEVPDDLDDGDKITVEVTAKLASGIEKTSKAKYTIGEEDDDNDDDDVYDDSVINSEGDDLAVDLWLVDDERFYELDEEIEFVAYYYNFESKDKEDVVLEIEIPEGFTIKNVIADRGTVKKKNGEYIKVTIGTVENKELEEVRFTLVAEDDDLSEEIAEIVATIYSDKDDEEDMSTQRIYIYEEGEDGSHKAFITGYTDGTFRPDNNITREEVAAMVARAFGHTATYSSRTFTDVKQTSWSYKYIAGCTNKGIITGYTDGSFKPYNNITRAELYAMIYRAMDLSLDNEKALLVPKEYKKDSSWETGYIAGLARLRMLEEMDETDADEYATRAEVVYLISRVQFRNPSKAYASYYSDVNSSYWCAQDIAAASIDYTFERKSGGKEDIDD